MKPLGKGSGALADLARQALERILDVLPETDGVDWSRHRAGRWRSGPVGGALAPLGHLDPIELTDLLGVDDQKAQLVANTEQFLRGFPANNALLWGSRGTGKSSLVHAVLNRYAPDGLRLVEVDKEALRDVATIVAYLDSEPYRYVLFCDDLSFEADDASYKALKSALEGSVFTQSENVLIYATSNRRHLLAEHMSDNTSARHVDGELHEAEAVEEKISLSDRFGLWLSFYPFRQDDYLRVARHWFERLGADEGVAVRWDDSTRQDALRWALARGVRSGRTAFHFARQRIGAAALARSADGGRSS
ncbi:MAG: ATP-binding protein [Gammaproteobacteria bacterium]|nr:ATP-binding protein [Gammaproteobacteria bacterium]